jgi:hypothetical protein
MEHHNIAWHARNLASLMNHAAFTGAGQAASESAPQPSSAAAIGCGQAHLSAVDPEEGLQRHAESTTGLCGSAFNNHKHACKAQPHFVSGPADRPAGYGTWRGPPRQVVSCLDVQCGLESLISRFNSIVEPL